MTPTPFIHYFRCECGELRRGVTGQTIICLRCMVDHELEPTGRREVSFGPTCTKVAALLSEMP